MITPDLWMGFEIIAAVTVMTMVVCPVLLWVLPDRIHAQS